jgi:hypothetical protein
MNDEKQKELVRASMIYTLDRLKVLPEQDRTALILEMMENLAYYESEEILMCPNLPNPLKPEPDIAHLFRYLSYVEQIIRDNYNF